MVAIPQNLADWDIETVRNLAVHHAYEPGFFDFKAVLNSPDPNHARNLAKTVCAMANAGGGYLIFGVADAKVGAASIEDRITGIPIGGEHLKEFADKIKTIQPEVHFEGSPSPILFEHDPSRGIFVVRVPVSARRPHLVSGPGAFFTRGDGGSARPMGYFEVREQMLHTEERLEQLNLVRLKLVQFRQLCMELRAREGLALRHFHGRFETDGFDALLATVCAVLPGDRNLIEELLRLPALCGALNRLLVRWHINDSFGHQLRSDDPQYLEVWQVQIHGEAQIIRGLCDRLEAALRDHLGSLKGF